MLNQSRSPSQPSKNSFWGAAAPIAIAHRGGGAAYGKERHRVENTLEVFKAASSLGFEYLEIDVIKTIDDRVVVIHATVDKLERLARKKDAPSAAKIQTLTHSQLKAVLARQVPTLGEVLRAFPETKFFIDPKSDEVVEALANEIIENDALSRVCFDSFYSARLARLKELLGDRTECIWNVSRYARLFNRRLKALLNGDYSKELINGVGLPYKFSSVKTIKLFHERGLKVLVWTPNTRSRIERSIELGADGIISDNIGLLKEVLAEN